LEQGESSEQIEKLSLPYNVGSAMDALSQYLGEVYNRDMPNPEDKASLIEQKENGDRDAYWKFFEGHLRFVISIAMRYNGFKLSLEDIIQEGNLGLMKAITKFDPNRGVSFMNYAGRWIRQEIRKAVFSNENIVYIPREVAEHIYIIDRLRAKFYQENRREATDEEIQAMLVWEIGASERRAIVARDPLLFDTIVSDSDDDPEIRLEEVIIDTMIVSPEEAAVRHELRVIAFEGDFLSEQEKQVLLLRYGNYEFRPVPFIIIGKELKITDKRVEQIEKAAFSKIRDYYDSAEGKLIDDPKELLIILENMRKLRRKGDAGFMEILQMLLTIEELDESVVTAHEKELLCMYYGLLGQIPKSVQAIAEETGITYGSVNMAVDYGRRKLGKHPMVRDYIYKMKEEKK